MPRYAISDIHGCAKTFVRLLETISLHREDELFLLGDYVDRGPDSYGVIAHIWSLQAAGYQLTCLRGNHEEMLLDALNGRGRAWDYYPDLPKAPAVRDWMDGLPFYAETPGYLLVHAGLNFKSREPLADTEAMLWARNWEGDIDTDWLAGRIVIYGHTPRSRSQLIENARYLRTARRLCIDSGCAMTPLRHGLPHRPEP